MEELGIDYNLQLFERVKNRAPPELKKTHPLGKSPQLITPEGRVIVERAAISRYLIDRYDTAGKFKINPNDSENDSIREEELMSFSGSSLAPILMVKLIFTLMRDGSPFFIRPVMGGLCSIADKAFITAELDAMYQYLDDILAGKDYFLKTEHPTRVDFAMLWSMDNGEMAGRPVGSKYPNLKAWYERCKARDAWKRSIEKGNGYSTKISM